MGDILLDKLKLAKTHYENFPVVSFLIPKKYRKDVALVYFFARTADDLADEGEYSATDRLNALKDYEEIFSRSLTGDYESEFWKELHFTIIRRNLLEENFFKLLSAFKQDVTKNRYADFNELLNYCERSANPVGRVMLELFDYRDPNLINYSDKICTALQLTNFHQDTSVDLKKGRIYIPMNEIKKYGVTEENFLKLIYDNNFIDLMKFQVDRTKKLFEEGKKIVLGLRGSFKKEINWTIMGGEKVLQKIEKINYNVLQIRPKLTKLEFLILSMKALIK